MFLLRVVILRLAFFGLHSSVFPYMTGYEKCILMYFKLLSFVIGYYSLRFCHQWESFTTDTPPYCPWRTHNPYDTKTSIHDSSSYTWNIFVVRHACVYWNVWNDIRVGWSWQIFFFIKYLIRKLITIVYQTLTCDRMFEGVLTGISRETGTQEDETNYELREGQEFGRSFGRVPETWPTEKTNLTRGTGVGSSVVSRTKEWRER